MSTSTQSVKAWLYTTTSYPDSLKQDNYHIPTTPPTPTSVIIKPHAVSLNPVDIQLINLPFNDLPASTPMLGDFSGPKIAGRDFSGTIIASGSDTPYRPGDTVCGINMSVPGTGFLAERVVLDLDPSRGANVIPKPSHLSHVQAASLPCVYLTAKTIIDKCIPYCTAEPASSNKLVVLGGSSSTGLYTIRLAKQAGWTILSSCSTQKIEFVKSRGADEVVDYTTSPTAVPDAIRAFKPSAIIDCVGGTDCIGLAPQYVSIVGDKTSRNTMGGSALYWTNPTMVVRWLAGWLGVGKGYECITLDNRRDWLEEINGVEADEVVIDSVFEFERVKEAFERLDTGRAKGKVVVRIVEDEE